MENKWHLKVSNEILLISLYGFLISTSTQMLYSQLVIFLKYNLGISESQIAIIDGFVEFLSYAIRIFSGAISDYLSNRKLLIIIGCIVIASIKPIFAFISSVTDIILCEIIERIGNGIQATSREAYIGDLSKKNNVGKYFAFFKSIKTIGAIFGSTLAIFIMWIFNKNYNILFSLAAIPALLAIFPLVKINSNDIRITKKTFFQIKIKNPFQKKYMQALDKKFLYIITLAFMCELSHFTESLLTIRASNFFSNTTLASATTIFATVGQIFFLYPIGILSDIMRKSKLLIGCITLSIFSYIIIIIAPSINYFFCGVFFLCGQQSAIQLIFLSAINEKVDSNIRGTAIGIFYSTIGISYLISSKVFGMIYENFGYNNAFFYALFICCINLALSIYFLKYEDKIP